MEAQLFYCLQNVFHFLRRLNFKTIFWTVSRSTAEHWMIERTSLYFQMPRKVDFVQRVGRAVVVLCQSEFKYKHALSYGTCCSSNNWNFFFFLSLRVSQWWWFLITPIYHLIAFHSRFYNFSFIETFFLCAVFVLYSSPS